MFRLLRALVRLSIFKKISIFRLIVPLDSFLLKPCVYYYLKRADCKVEGSIK